MKKKYIKRKENCHACELNDMPKWKIINHSHSNTVNNNNDDDGIVLKPQHTDFAWQHFIPKKRRLLFCC